MGKADYTLLDVETNNVVGAYDTEQLALEDMRDAIARYGARSEAVRDLGLHGRDGFIAVGADLVAHALKHNTP